MAYKGRPKKLREELHGVQLKKSRIHRQMLEQLHQCEVSLRFLLEREGEVI